MIRTAFIFTLSLTILANTWAQGPLAPPGPPSPVMRSLDQIEPRTPISSVPAVIDQPGSYYLTSDLSLPTGTGSAILIQSDGVTLDLMGFTLSGGTQFGIRVQPPTDVTCHDITVRNGTIRGFGTAMSLLGSVGGLYEDLQILNADSTGLTLSTGSRNNMIRRSTIANAGGWGINISVSGADQVASGNVIEDCIIVGNGSHGIRLRATTAAAVTDNIVRRCTIANNGESSIYGVHMEVSSETAVLKGNQLIDNTIANNGSRGINLRPASGAISHTVVEGNAIHGHDNAGVIGSPAPGTSGDVSGTRIARNAISWNRFNGGIRFSGSLTATQMAIRDNVLADNGVGTAFAHLRIEVGEHNLIQGNHISGMEDTSLRGLRTEDTEGQLVIHNSVFGEPVTISADDRYGLLATWTPVPDSQWLNFHLD